MSEPIKVLVVDDSALVRKVITDILARDPMIQVVGTANNGKSAIFKTSQLNPDVITMDIEMPICNGLVATRLIKAELPEIKVVMLTVSSSDRRPIAGGRAVSAATVDAR